MAAGRPDIAPAQWNPPPLQSPPPPSHDQLGKLTLDKTFQERDHLNVMIVAQSAYQLLGACLPV